MESNRGVMAPPSEGSGLTTISVSPDLRDDLAQLKLGGRSFEDILKFLLEDRGLEGWKERIERTDEGEIAKVKARKARLEGARSVTRDPSEQTLLAEAARDRWQRWQESGRLQKTGDRRWSYEAQPHGDPPASIRRVR